MKINISNNTDNEINISGLDCVVLIPINTFENIREIIDILMTTYGQNETKIIGYIKNHTHFIGFKFEQNVIIRINILQKLLKILRTKVQRFITGQYCKICFLPP